jgi:hypothetical protein
MLGVFDPDQDVLWCHYPIKIGDVQAVMENDEAFGSRFKQKNLGNFAYGTKCILESRPNVSWRVKWARNSAILPQPCAINSPWDFSGVVVGVFFAVCASWVL